MNRWLKLAVLAVVAFAVTQLFVQHPETTLPGGASAPPLALKNLAGKTVDLGALRGRVVLVNFWATWCPPCRAELPELAELWLEQKDRCFELLGVAEESPPAALASASRSIPYPILTDPSGEAATAWSVYGYPSSYIVSPDGVVVRTFSGAVRKQEVLEAIRPHLPASCKGS